MAETWIDFLRLMDGSLRFAAPLILCAMAGLVSERSGVIDIGLEGKLLAGAFAAGAAASITGSAPLVPISTSRSNTASSKRASASPAVT